MQLQDPSNRELTTWSEIAAYLGVTDRTAQQWRKDRGLPVRKFGGRVVANTFELDRWKAGASDTLPERPVHNRSLRSRWIVAGIVLAIAGGTVAAAGWVLTGAASQRRGQMVRHTVRGTVLAVFDEFGEQAWTHDFRSPVTERTEPGRITSQYVDVDGDGSAELLFVRWAADRTEAIYCFRRDGTLAWEHPIGQTVVDTAGATISPDYVGVKLLVLRSPRPDGGRIVVLSHHVSSWPARVAILTPAGKEVAEYWHRGWLDALSLGDLDGDGKDEVILGGITQGFGDADNAATLLVLDSALTTGQGPALSAGSRQLRGIPFTEPRAFLVFPDVSHSSGTRSRPGTWIDGAEWVGDYLDVRTKADRPWEYVHYQLDRRLRVVHIAPATPLIDSLAPNANPDRRRELVRNAFGRINVVRNSFDRP